MSLPSMPSSLTAGTMASNPSCNTHDNHSRPIQHITNLRRLTTSLTPQWSPTRYACLKITMISSVLNFENPCVWHLEATSVCFSSSVLACIIETKRDNKVGKRRLQWTWRSMYWSKTERYVNTAEQQYSRHPGGFHGVKGRSSLITRARRFVQMGWVTCWE